MEMVFFLAAILIVGAVLFAVITMTKGGAKQLDVDRYRRKWLEIERRLKRDDTATHQLCVLEADKLLDAALKEKGVSGATMGERMKATEWSSANVVWTAHKLRNQIAHEPDVRVDYDTARRALAGFKQGLKDIGAI